MKHLCRILSLLSLTACMLSFAACDGNKEAATSSAWTTVARTTANSTVASTSATAMKTTARPTTAPTTPTERTEPEDSGYTQGQTGYSTFDSAYIGLGIKLTGDWKFLSRRDINTLDGNPIDFLTNGNDRGIGMIKHFTEVWAQNGEGDHIKIELTENESPLSLEKRVTAQATALESQLLASFDSVDVALTAVTCAGATYPGAELCASKDGQTVYTLMFLKDLGDYTAAVHIVKHNGTFERELAMIFES